MIVPLGIAGGAVCVTSFVNDVEGWKLATLAFIVGREVAAELVIEADTVGSCEAAARLAVEATFSEEGDEACTDDTVAVDCAGTGCSLEEPVSTFLIPHLLATLPDFADEPLASEETEASLCSDIPGDVTLRVTESRASDAVAVAGVGTVRLTGARGTVFSLEAVAVSGVVT